MTSQLSAALRATAEGIYPDEAGAGLVISHGAFLIRDDFTRHIETAPSVSDGRRLSASGGEKRITRIAASLAAGHPVSLRDTVPGLDQRSLQMVTAAIRHAAGQRE